MFDYKIVEFCESVGYWTYGEEPYKTTYGFNIFDKDNNFIEESSCIFKCEEEAIEKAELRIEILSEDMELQYV